MWFKNFYLKFSKKYFKILKKYAIITIGTFVMAVGLNLFLIPNKIVTGGVSGLATVLHYLTNVPVGALILLINIPLFVIGMRTMGRTFIIRTAYATILLSAFVDITSAFPALSPDPVISSLYGGASVGLGMGLVFLSAASTGGTDLIAKSLNKWLPMFSMGKIILATDALVILFAVAAFRDYASALYAFFALFINSVVIDMVVEGVNFAKAVYIISEQEEVIARNILFQMGRGVTALDGHGLYTEGKRRVLLCVISKREVIRLKNIVKKSDPNAFVVISDAKEVLGEGFKE